MYFRDDQVLADKIQSIIPFAAIIKQDVFRTCGPPIIDL